ncbi:3-oxoacyl-ACP reductase FabG [Streptomyces sp. NPDC090075]|uniref:3-oxoacyl-ACP reductase FabG n=1 Tax=Streptomyces sp. NPDC090075 TaxID=3365937 RepID=UPI00381902D0
MKELEGRVALVTGAARGIGAGIAQRFAEAGARVAVLDLDAVSCADTVAAVEAAGAKALTLAVDVSDTSAVDGAVDEVVRQFGQLDIAVNNAGVTRDNLLFKMTEDDWDTVLRVHLKGAFNISKAAQRHMVAATYGRIVNLSSVSALGNRGQANYAAAKMGMQGFTRTLAIELGPFGITANAIAPGYIDTEMTRATAERMGVPLEERLESMAKTTPVRRIGYPSDIANAALFFASEASGFVTGQTIYVDGGRRL